MLISEKLLKINKFFLHSFLTTIEQCAQEVLVPRQLQQIFVRFVTFVELPLNFKF